MGWLCMQRLFKLSPTKWMKSFLIMQKLFKIVNGWERCLCYVQRYGREEVMGCNKNKCKVNKTKKMKPVSKNPKLGQVVLKNGMGPTKKPKQFLRIKIQTGVPNKLKNDETLIFWFTNKKTVFKNGVPNKAKNTALLTKFFFFFTKINCQ